MKNKSIYNLIGSAINILVGLVIFGFGVYVVYYIITEVDFNTTTIIIHDNKELWKFIAFIPIMACMFCGAMCILNSILRMKTLNVIALIFTIGLAVFINYDLWGFASIVQKYNDLMMMLFKILNVASGLLVIDIILNIMNGMKRKEKTKVVEA